MINIEINYDLTKKDVCNSIKYLLEQKAELEREIRVGEEATKELHNLESKLKFYMAQYIGGYHA